MPNDTANSTLLANQIFTNSMPEFNPDKDNWLLWTERLEVYFEEIECTEDRAKRAILLKSIGAEAYSVLRSLCDPVLSVKKPIDELYKLLADHYTPTIIVFRERKQFFAAEKHETESISAWYARIKKLALNCKFGQSSC